jgi:hypothetical protein
MLPAGTTRRRLTSFVENSGLTMLDHGPIDGDILLSEDFNHSCRSQSAITFDWAPVERYYGNTAKRNVPMSKAIASILTCGMLLGSANLFTAQAMPLSFAPAKAAGSDVTLVAGGCGIGWHRGAYGYCRRNGSYVAPPVIYSQPIVVAPQACPYGGYWVGRYWHCY